MKAEILFRPDEDNTYELSSAYDYFRVTTQRSWCSKDSLVVGRYSVLPFYRELERDLQDRNSKLINSYNQHDWIASFGYYRKLKYFTPTTWTDETFCYAPEGEYVLKGATNSKKHQWNTHMFAASKRQAMEVAGRLANDSLVGSQQLLYREYVPLKTFSKGLNGLRYTNEWRFFFLRDKILSYAYYWSCEENAITRALPMEGIAFAKKIAAIAEDYVNFFVVDIAETESGEWIMIELNDAQMSGLSLNNPAVMYGNLYMELSRWKTLD